MKYKQQRPQLIGGAIGLRGVRRTAKPAKNQLSITFSIEVLA